MIIHLAICADRNMEIGLHVTLHSAMSSLIATSEAIVNLFLRNFYAKQIHVLNSTVREFGNRCKNNIYDVSKFDIGIGRGLHGNKIPAKYCQHRKSFISRFRFIYYN